MGKGTANKKSKLSDKREPECDSELDQVNQCSIGGQADYICRIPPNAVGHEIEEAQEDELEDAVDVNNASGDRPVSMNEMKEVFQFMNEMKEVFQSMAKAIIERINGNMQQRVQNKQQRSIDSSLRRHQRHRADRNYSRQCEEYTSESEEYESEYSDHSSVSSYNNRRRKLKNMTAKIPPFTGKESWEVWYNRFSEVADRRRWTDEDKLDELLPRLQGGAGEFVFSQLPKRTRTNYRKLVKELSSRYRVVETKKTFAAQFSRRNQKPGETAEEYAAELKRLYDKVHPDRRSRTRDEDLLRRFLDGIQDSKASFQVEFVKEPEDIDEAVFDVVSFLETKYYPEGKESDRRTRSARAKEYFDSCSESYDEQSEGEKGRMSKVKRVQTHSDVKSGQLTPEIAGQKDRNIEELMNRVKKLEAVHNKGSPQRRENGTTKIGNKEPV